MVAHLSLFSSIKHSMNDGNYGVIKFSKGNSNEFFKRDGMLQVVGVCLVLLFCIYLKRVFP